MRPCQVLDLKFTVSKVHVCPCGSSSPTLIPLRQTSLNSPFSAWSFAFWEVKSWIVLWYSSHLFLNSFIWSSNVRQVFSEMVFKGNVSVNRNGHMLNSQFWKGLNSLPSSVLSTKLNSQDDLWRYYTLKRLEPVIESFVLPGEYTALEKKKKRPLHVFLWNPHLIRGCSTKYWFLNSS